MKIALVLAGNIWFAPYVRIYTNFFKKAKVDYSIISWNRDGQDQSIGFQYNKKWSNVDKGGASFFAYFRYIRFVIKTIRCENFDRLIIFGPQLTILLGAFLMLYHKRFIIDYRDLSIEQKPGLYQLYSLLTGWSYANVISSPGFKKCLPKRDYFISHNFDFSLLNKGCADTSFNKNEFIDILTIGSIRDYSSNINVVKALANKPNIRMRFVGKGEASLKIEEYCNQNEVANTMFYGYYEKKDEPEFISQCTFLNIFYPRVVTHDTAMSNRFYNSLIFRRPMIVTKDTIQGDFVEKYNVGIAIENCSNLYERILDFLNTDFEEYSQSCDRLLRVFMYDEVAFEQMLSQFINKAESR